MTNKANRSLIKRNVENLIAIILSGGVKKFECVTEIFAGKVAERKRRGPLFAGARLEKLRDEKSQPPRPESPKENAARSSTNKQV
jgi:hypothetical protein